MIAFIAQPGLRGRTITICIPSSAKLAKLHNSESDCIHIVILPMIDGRARVTSEPNKTDLVNGGGKSSSIWGFSQRAQDMKIN